LVIAVGTMITIYGTHSLTQFWGKKDAIRNSYTLPDIVEMDCKMQVKISDSLKKDIFKKLPKEDKTNPSSIYLTGYFDKYLAKSNPNFKKNFKIFNKEIYSIFENLTVHMIAKTSVSSMKLKRNSDKIVLTSENIPNSRVMVKEINSLTNTLSLEIYNLQLSVESQALLIADFDKSDYNLHFIFDKAVSPIKIEEAFLKTKNIQYYYLSSPKYENQSGAFIGKLKSQIDFN